MLLNCLLLAICVSIDSLGIGLTYGLKDTKITLNSKLILFIIAIIITSISIFVGNFICKLFSPFFCNVLACIILCSMGLWIMLHSITKSKKEYKFFIKFLGITIQIIRNPLSSDFNKSNKIEAKEAIYLGIALSLDSIGIAIGGSIVGILFPLFPILVGLFQLFFLSIGSYLGKKIKNASNIPENIWSILSGSLLIMIGISKLLP